MAGKSPLACRKPPGLLGRGIECQALYLSPVMEKVQPTRKPWLLAIELCPNVLCLPRVRTPLVIENMAFRGPSNEGKATAHLNEHKAMESGIMFRGTFLSASHLVVFRVRGEWQRG